MNRQIALNNINKGFEYEVQIRDHIINNLGDVAYLWKDVPDSILIKYNFISSYNAARLHRIGGTNPLRDNGIDIIQIDKNGKCRAIQCKNGYGKHGLILGDLGGFSTQVLSRDHLINKKNVIVIDVVNKKRIDINYKFNISHAHTLVLNFTWTPQTHKFIDDEDKVSINGFIMCNNTMGIYRVPQCVRRMIYNYLVNI